MVRQQTYPETLVILAGWGGKAADGVGLGLGDGKAADVFRRHSSYWPVGGTEWGWGMVRQQTYPETLVILAGWGDGVGLGDGKAADIPRDARHTGRLGGLSGGWGMVRQQTYPETLVILAGWGDGVGLGAW